MPDSAAPPAVATARAGHRRWPIPVLVVGILVLAFNLRGSITSLPPLFPELSTSLHLSPAAIAALAATPVLCFGVFSGVAAPLSRRYGEERVLLAALALLAVGLVGRGALPGRLLFPGTVLAGAAIALMNVLLPSLVKRRNPDRAGLLIGVYLLCLASGGIVGALIAVPVTLGMWAIPALAAALVWVPQLRYRTLPGGSPATAGRRPNLSRSRLTW